MGASILRSLNFLSVPIFVAFKSPSPARRRVMLDLIVGARKKTKLFCTILLFPCINLGSDAFSSHLGRTWSRVKWSTWSRALHCCVQEEKYLHRRENIGVKLIAGITASSFKMYCLFTGKVDNGRMFDCYNQFVLFLVPCS